MKHNIYYYYYYCASVEPYQRPYYPHIFYNFFFFFLNFSFPYSQKKKKKILINPHLVLHFSVTPLSFFSLFYILTPLLLILFCIKFDIISIIQSIFFSHKTISTLSLLSFCVFLFIFITLFLYGVLSYNFN